MQKDIKKWRNVVIEQLTFPMDCLPLVGNRYVMDGDRVMLKGYVFMDEFYLTDVSSCIHTGSGEFFTHVFWPALNKSTGFFGAIVQWDNNQGITSITASNGTLIAQDITRAKA